MEKSFIWDKETSSGKNVLLNTKEIVSIVQQKKGNEVILTSGDKYFIDKTFTDLVKLLTEDGKSIQ